MKTKDKQNEQQRHAQRNYVIREVRNSLVTEFKYSYTEADIFIGRIWGIGERKNTRNRPDKTDWRSKHFSDPNLRQYKQLMNEIDEKKESAEKLVAQLATDHPKCVHLGFSIAFLSK